MSIELMGVKITESDWSYKRGSYDDEILSDMHWIDTGEMTEEQLYNRCIQNYYSVEAIEEFLNNGYLLAYEQQLKDEGWIPQSFVRSGASSGTGSDTQTVNDTGTTNDNHATEKTYTDEEIEAAWQETSRTEPTCTETGAIQYKNSLTGKTKTDVLDVIDHDYQITGETAATCVDPGETVYTCTMCGDSYTEEVPLADHDYAVSETVEPTCEEAGKTTYTCNVCGDSYEETMDATGHTAGELATVTEPGWFTTGLQESACTVCGTVLASEVIAQTCPLPLYAVLLIAVVVVAAVGAVVVIVRKKSSKS
jgi:hypothetical protein